VEPGAGDVEGLPDKKHGPGFGKVRTKKLNDLAGGSEDLLSGPFENSVVSRTVSTWHPSMTGDAGTEDSASSGSPHMSDSMAAEAQSPGVSAMPCTGSSRSSVIGCRPALQFVFATMHTAVCMMARHVLRWLRSSWILVLPSMPSIARGCFCHSPFSRELVNAEKRCLCTLAKVRW
jgi:hypothetical protein